MPSTDVLGERLFARHVEWIQECKGAVHALRLTIKQAKAHREKCCSVLGAALAAALALEQAVHSCANSAAKAQELQRLYAAVAAAIELAQQRVQVYGAQSRIRKYTSLSRRTAIDSKFSQVIDRLEDLTKQIWGLSAANSPEPPQDARVHVSVRSSAAAASQMLTTSLQSRSRSRLRRGCQCHAVRSVLYIGHTLGRLDSANDAGQVWWFLAGVAGGKLFAHDLASAATKELQSFQGRAAVECMQVDSQGYVWIAFKGSMVQVWDAQTRSCLCEASDIGTTDIRVLSSDDESNSMWAGTERGASSQLSLVARKIDSRLMYSIDTLQTLQLTPISHQLPRLVTAAAASAEAANLLTGQQHRQLPTPFSQAPRQLTLSSSASSYRGSNGVVESVQNPLYQPVGPLQGDRIADFALSDSFNGQQLSTQPVLSNQVPSGLVPCPILGLPPQHPPGRAFSAELLHGYPHHRPGSTSSLSRPPSMHRSGSTSPAESQMQEARVLHMPSQGTMQRQGSMQRQVSMQRQGSVHSSGSFPTGRAVSGPVGCTDSAFVHALAIVGGRLVTSSGLEPHCGLREWSLGGVLLMTHPCCELGCTTCIAAVPELVKVAPSAPVQTPTCPPDLSSSKPSGSANGQMLTGHSSGDLKLWQASQQGFHQPLAVIRAASRSPVQSLVILPNINLICSAHLEGCISLFVSPERSASYHLPSVQIDSSLPSLNLPGANFQAHKSGLRQCVAGDSGLVSLGAFGSIMLWPEAELKATLNSVRLQHPGRLIGACVAQEPLKQPLLRHLERAFTPLSARAVESALQQVTQELVHEEEAQLHQMPPALAALQRGDPVSAQDTPRMLREVLQMVTLSHADSNEAPLSVQPPQASPLGTPLDPSSAPSLNDIPQDFVRPQPQRLQRASGGSAQSYGSHALYSQRSQRYSADVELHTPRTQPDINQFNRLSSMDTVHHAAGPYDFLDQPAAEAQHAQHAQHPQQQQVYDSRLQPFIEPQQAEQRRSFEFEAPDLRRQSHESQAEPIQHRASLEGRSGRFTTAPLNAQTQTAQANQAEMAVTRAPPPPVSTENTRQDPQSRSSVLSMAAKSRRSSAVSEGSPAGSAGTYRAASQLLRLESHPSDPFSMYDSSHHEASHHDSSLNTSIPPPGSFHNSQQPPLQPRPTPDPVGSGPPGAHVIQSHDEQLAHVGSRPNLDRAAMSVVQEVKPLPAATSAMPRSQSQANLRQGLNRMPSESTVLAEPDKHPKAAEPAQNMRRTKSKLSLDTLASVESMNCTIIDYSQLEVKRKIGDGSIGQVYLGKWQETDVAIKVLTEIQSLCSGEGVQPQDPATLHSRKGDSPPPRQGGNKANHAGGLKVITDDTESHGWGTDDDSSIGQDSGVQTPQDNKEVLKTLEREVSIMAALRHPNVVMFMGLCLEPPCIVTEFCARGSLYDVLKKARGTPAFAQQLDWSRRLSMALDAAKGVLQLHSHKPPILHRDLKSPNMLVDRHWRVKVTDFNLSRMVKTGSNNASVTSLLANNPRWLAPEVVSKHDYSKAADVYSFGIILWEMMTWRLPWDELNPFQIMMVLTQQRERPEIPPLDTLPGQPLPGIGEYILLMQDCWSEDVSKRPRFEDIIISLRGLLESAASRHKLQKTLTAVPRLSVTCAVAPNMNKLPVVGQTPFGAPGTDPAQTPTPLQGLAKPGPLQVYETHRPFFGSTPAGGLDIVTSASNSGKKRPSSSNQQAGVASEGQSQQALLQNAMLKAKGLSPPRRHTFNGSDTEFGDAFDTAPSLFMVKSRVIGGVHAQYNAQGGPELDPTRRKSMSGAAPAVKTAKQVLPDWLLQQCCSTPSFPPPAQGGSVHDASSRDSSMPAGPQYHLTGQRPEDEVTPNSATGNFPVGQMQPSNSDSWHKKVLPVSCGAAADTLADSSQRSMTQPEAAGSGDKHRPMSASNRAPQADAASLTPFSAFAQHTQHIASCTSSGTGDSDSTEQPGAERQRSGNLALPRRSGSFGGRGAALGYMMAAQQQWRQDSFSQAREQRRIVAEDSRSNKSPPKQGQMVQANSPQQPDVTSSAKDSENPALRGKLLQIPSTAGKAGFEEEASNPTEACDSSLPSSAGTAQQQLPQSPGLAEASGTNQSGGTKPATSLVGAILNPFLAAAQLWQKSRSSDSSDESDHSNSNAPHESSAQPPDPKPSGAAADSEAAHPEAADSKADSAAIAERWLVARQESLDQSDQSKDWNASAARQAPTRSRSASADDKVSSGRGLNMQGSPQSAAWSPSKGPRAGPPPDKGTFQNRPSAFHEAGVESSSPFTSSAASVTSQGSWNSDVPSFKPSFQDCGAPPRRRASFNPNAGPMRLDTIQSDSSAEVLAQYSTKSSSASASSAQLTSATAIVDDALKESVSGSGNHSERLPSLLLSKELDDVPFQTRLQTVIEGLEQVNSPGKGHDLSASPKVVHADGSVTDVRPGASYGSYVSSFAAAKPADLE